MPQILNIVLTIIAPIIVVAGLGGLLDRIKAFEARNLSRVTIYVASPALAFYGMANATIRSDELLGLVASGLLTASISAVIGWVISRVFKMPRLTASAFVLSVCMINIGNYGIPFNEFAFGRPGLERALVMAVTQIFFAYSVGVFLASWGRASILKSLKNAISVPGPYAAGLGLLVNFAHLPLPDLVMRVAYILQGAAVPLMLLLLGIQIARVEFRGGPWPIILGASGLRLVGGPLIGIAVATALGLEGVTWQVAVIQSAMPTAVVTTILATEFESDPQITSSVVLVSTLSSVATLSVLLYLVQ